MHAPNESPTSSASERQTLALSDRRCEECDCYMWIAHQTRTGGIKLYECPLGHVLLIGAQGQVIK